MTHYILINQSFTKKEDIKYNIKAFFKLIACPKSCINYEE